MFHSRSLTLLDLNALRGLVSLATLGLQLNGHTTPLTTGGSIVRFCELFEDPKLQDSRYFQPWGPVLLKEFGKAGGVGELIVSAEAEIYDRGGAVTAEQALTILGKIRPS